MKRITELEKSRILEMYQSIPMKPWLFEQKSDFAIDRQSAALLSKSSEDYKERVDIINKAQKELLKSSMSPETFKDFVESWRYFVMDNPVGIGLEVAISWHPYGKIAVTAMWGAFLVYDLQEAINGNPNYLNLLVDFVGIISPHLLPMLSKIPKGIGNNLGKFVKKLGELEILAPIVEFLTKNWSQGQLLKSTILESISQFEKWLKFLSFGWAVKVLKWLGTNFIRLMKFIDDLVVKILEKSGIKSKFTQTVATTASQVYAITKIIDGIKYGWNEATEAWERISPEVEVVAAEIPRIPRQFENLDNKFYWTYNDKNELNFYPKSNTNYKWSVYYNGGDFQKNYNQGKAWEKGKGGWDSTTEVYFHKDAKINPSQWTKKK